MESASRPVIEVAYSKINSFSRYWKFQSYLSESQFINGNSFITFENWRMVSVGFERRYL